MKKNEMIRESREFSAYIYGQPEVNSKLERGEYIFIADNLNFLGKVHNNFRAAIERVSLHIAVVFVVSGSLNTLH
jgi:hypothetical protein